MVMEVEGDGDGGERPCVRRDSGEEVPSGSNIMYSLNFVVVQ